jgi:hypothetical protein
MYMRTGSVVAEFGIHRRERRFGLLLDVLVGRGHRRLLGDQQRLLVGRLVVDLDAHVAEGRNDGFDLLGVHQIVGQVVVDLRVGEKAAVFAELDQVLQARAAGFGVFLGQLGRDQPGVFLAFATRAPPALALDRIDLGLEYRERLLRVPDRALACGLSLAARRLVFRPCARSSRRQQLLRPARGRNGLAGRLRGCSRRTRNPRLPRDRNRSPLSLQGLDYLGLFPEPGDLLGFRLALGLGHPCLAIVSRVRGENGENRGL